MNMDVLNMLPKNDIPKPIMRSIFQSTNVELVDFEHFMNIIKLRQQKKYNEIEHVIETSGLINFDGIDINGHEQMINAFQNLHCNQCLFHNHRTTMINEHNNPNLITCMFSTLFPFGIGVPKMNNIPHVIITTNSCKTFNESKQNSLLVFKTSFISNFCIQHNTT